MDALVDIELNVEEDPDGGFVATCRAFPDLIFREPTPEAAANVLAVAVRDRLVKLTEARGGTIKSVLPAKPTN